jgi:tetratricopeptide (TPR) repeat protein
MRSKKIILTVVFILPVLAAILMTGCGTFSQKKQAEEYFNNGNYEEARDVYTELGMEDKVSECTYLIAQNCVDEKDYETAIKELETIPDYEGAPELLEDARYEYGMSLYEQGNFEKAMSQFEEVSDYKEASDYIKKSRYEYGIVLYVKGQYEDAMAQFEKIAEYNDTADYLDKCQMGLKYADFDYDNFYTSDIEDISAMSHEDIIEYVEKTIEPMYTKWYYYDDTGEEKELVIDKFHIGDKEYGVSLYSSPGHYKEFEIYYMDDENTKYSVGFTRNMTYGDVTDEVLYIMSIGEQDYRSYDTMSAENYAHLQEEAQPQYTIDEVYAQAQQDVKDEIYSQLSSDNIFDAIGFAATYTWNFESSDTIKYEYDSSTKTHVIEFTVSLSEYGLNTVLRQRMQAAYMESDYGLDMLWIYSVN